jgi:ribosomal protein S18 acetylase RimI-like enzyme
MWHDATVMADFVTRRATIDDVATLAETQRLGFESFAAFLPAGWTPPPVELEAKGIRERLSQPDAWCLIAQAGPDVAGQVALVAGRELGGGKAPIPGLAHLWMLFIREPWWGSGLATMLLAMAVEEATTRGYEAMRLFTPAGQARARRFYEREGWATGGERRWEPMLGFDLVEYRRRLPASSGDAATPGT